MVKTWAKRLYMAFIFLLLYLPIIVLVILSFNKSKARVTWRGFTFQWYANLFDNSRIMDAFTTTLTLAFGSALAATIIGVVGAIGISAMKKRNYSIMLGATNIPMLNAEIVTALSLTLLFIRFIKLGFTSVFIGHVTFGVPYVILNVLPRLRTLNKNAYEAALDLGATPLYAFFKVCWPELMPGIMSGFLMATTMSMDDFVITYFTRGPGINTISTMVYSEVKRGIQPEMYALSTLLFLLILVLLLLFNFLSGRKTVWRCKKRLMNMKHKLLIASVLSGSLFLLGGCGYNKNNSLVVFNYGDYLDPSIIDSFEKETGIKILYEEYQSPEEMYMKYKADIVDYDVICSSDYILEKLRTEDELLPINFDNIPNAANVDEHLWEFSKTFDPENKYTIPHYWGTLGILYNTRLVDEKVDSWDILFNSKYSGQIIMENSVRDSFVPALKMLGYSINTDNTDELDEAEKILIEQRPMVQAYLLDSARDEMIAENAAIALVYSGEAPYATEYNDDLAYVVPKEGSNVWVDSWAVTKDCKNTENAEKFLNYLLRVDISKISFEYNHYGTPNKKLAEILPAKYTEDPALFPPSDVLDNCEIFRSLDRGTQDYYSKLWKEIKLD